MTDKEKARLEFARSHKWAYPANEFGACKIHSTAQIGNVGFGWVKDDDGWLTEMPHAGNVVIEKFAEIGPLCTVDRAVVGSTVIGEGTKLDSHCHVGHGAKIGKHNTLAAHTIVEGSAEVGDNNTFGCGVIVQRKVKIGNNNIFGSGCVVVKDIGDNGKYVGNPARKL